MTLIGDCGRWVIGCSRPKRGLFVNFIGEGICIDTGRAVTGFDLLWVSDFFLADGIHCPVGLMEMNDVRTGVITFTSAAI